MLRHVSDTWLSMLQNQTTPCLFHLKSCVDSLTDTSDAHTTSLSAMIGAVSEKLYGKDTCPSHHQCETLAGDAGPVTGSGGLTASMMGKLQDKGKLRKVSFMYTVVMCMLLIVAPPIVVNAWSKAFLLRQHVEYYC